MNTRKHAHVAMLVVGLAALISPGAVPAQAHGNETVSVYDYGFSPPALAIDAGTTVTWVNDGNVVHEIAAHLHGPVMVPTGTEDFHAMINPGASFAYTFAATGVFVINCNLGGDHETMKMVIVVT